MVTAPVKFSFPAVVKVTTPLNVEVEAIVIRFCPIVSAPAAAVNAPATLRMPVAVPVIAPPEFKRRLPLTLRVLPVVQVSVPEIVRLLQAPGLASIVMVCPAWMVTSSAAVGVPTGSQLAGVLQVPAAVLLT